MRLYPVLALFVALLFSASDARAQDRATIIACWQHGATNMMLMQMCSGSWVPPDLLMSCLSGGPCGASPQPAAGQLCGAAGLPFCPGPQPCGRQFRPWTISCTPAPVWAPFCGAPPYPPCMEPQTCGLPGTFPCMHVANPPPIVPPWPTEDLEEFVEIEPTFAMSIPGGMALSPDDDQVGIQFAAPPIPDVNALQYCYDSTATEDDFFGCVTQEALPEDYRQIPACLAEYDGDPARQALCSIGNEEASEAYETFVEVQDCVDQAGDNEYDVAACLGEHFLDENEQYYMRCVTDNQGDLYLAGTCAVAKDLNPEQQIALACAVKTGGNPKAFAICTGGQLTARELSKCWDHGIATNDGCFGPNNEFRRVADTVRDGVCDATGNNSVVCDTYNLWHNNVLMPGPNHEAVKIINNGLNDLRHGPGENNEFVRAGKAVEEVFQSVGSFLGF